MRLAPFKTVTSKPATRPDTLFSGAFFLMTLFSFTSFFAGFQLFPTMPLRILALGGTKSQAGLFLGFFTFSSALSAPIGGAAGDLFGRRRVLRISSLVFFILGLIFATVQSIWILLPLGVLLGISWSALLAATFALLTDVIPASRRAEGLGYSGVAGTLAIAISPTVGLAIFQVGWFWLCGFFSSLSLGMLVVTFLIRHDRIGRQRHAELKHLVSRKIFEHRVFAVAVTLLLYSFGYGGITSFVAIYTQESGTSPPGIFFIVFASVMAVSRPLAGRIADRWGRKRVFVPCLLLIVAGQSFLPFGASLGNLTASAVLYGLGFGAAFPAFASLVLDATESARSGAAFGSILMAFDIGIGSGSIVHGVLIEHYGYTAAFALSTLVAFFSIPYFHFSARLLNPVAKSPTAARSG